MRINQQKRRRGELEFGIIYGLILVSLIAAARFPVSSIMPSCAFHRFFGFACPTCGATRSFVHLSHGEIAGAFVTNPLVTACVLVMLIYFVYSVTTRLLNESRFRLSFSPAEKGCVKAAIIAVFLANWIYLILTV